MVGGRRILSRVKSRGEKSFSVVRVVWVGLEEMEVEEGEGELVVDAEGEGRGEEVRKRVEVCGW